MGSDMPPRGKQDDAQQSVTRREAAEWVVRMAGDGPNDAAAADFDAWRKADPGNGRAYDAALELWASDDLTAALRGTDGRRREKRRKGAPVVAFFTFPRVAMAGLAIAAVAWLGMSHWASLTADFATDTGEIGAFELADGSNVRLDTASALDFQADGTTRHAVLRQGRVYFDVKEDARRPFVINVGDVSVTVRGTAFDVGRDGDHVSVAVRHGRVEVAPPAGQAGVVLRKGDAVHVSLKTGAAERQVAHTFDWLDGRIRVKNATVAEVARRLDTYAPGRIIVLNEELARQRLSGSFTVADVDATLKTIAKILEARVTGTSRLVAVLR